MLVAFIIPSIIFIISFILIFICSYKKGKRIENRKKSSWYEEEYRPNEVFVIIVSSVLMGVTGIILLCNYISYL